MGFFFSSRLPIVRIRSCSDTEFAYALSCTEFLFIRTILCSAENTIWLPCDGASVLKLLLLLLEGDSAVDGACWCDSSFVVIEPALVEPI